MQDAVLFWVIYDCWTLLMPTVEGRCSYFWGQARFSTLIKDLSTLEHWGLAFPGRRLGQSMKTKILATWITQVRVSSCVLIHYIPSNYEERGTKHHSENFLPWFLPRHALLHWLQRESHVFKLSKGCQLNPTVLIFPAWLANPNVSPCRTPQESFSRVEGPIYKPCCPPVHQNSTWRITGRPHGIAPSSSWFCRGSLLMLGTLRATSPLNTSVRLPVNWHITQNV